VNRPALIITPLVISFLVTTLVFAGNSSDNSGSATVTISRPKRLGENMQFGPTQNAAVDSIYCIAEARPVQGRKGRVTVAVIDKDANPALDFSGTIELSSNTDVDLPEQYTFGIHDKGSHDFFVNFPPNMVSRVTAKWRDISAVSNPVLPRKAAEPGIYFGDIHAHSTLSDGIGDSASGYEYARKFNGLDFAAFSDHNQKGDKWRKTVEIANRYNADNEFVTFIGFEWTDNDRGHKNVFYRGDDGPECPEEGYTSLPEIPVWWAQLDKEKVRALTIPVHPNIQAKAKRPDGQPAWHATNWSYTNHTYQRLVEIFQNLGSSEAPGGTNKELGIRNSDCGSSVQTALSMGHRLGFIGSTDTHLARPGIGAGRCAIVSNDYSRGGLWDALYERSCYAITGEHILVFFTVNQQKMGSELILSDVNQSRKIQWRAIGTSGLKRVELLCNNIVVKSWDGAGKDDLCGNFEKKEPLSNTEWWYLRVVQEDGHMAWSSPVWVDPAVAGTP